MRVALVVILAAALFALLGLGVAWSIVVHLDKLHTPDWMFVASFVLLPLGGAGVGTAIARFGVGLARLHPEVTALGKEL